MSKWASDKGLGPLELEVLRLLWRHGSATVRDLMATGQIPGAYTTIMTTLSRLHQKGILSRTKDDSAIRAFRYTPLLTEEEFHSGFVTTAIRRLLATNPEPQILCSQLIETLSEHDIRLLDQLQEAIESKRKSLDARDES